MRRKVLIFKELGVSSLLTAGEHAVDKSPLRKAGSSVSAMSCNVFRSALAVNNPTVEDTGRKGHRGLFCLE
jgi:hypothetical protein